VVNCIPHASYISFKRVSQILINYSFNKGFFHINQAKNFFSHMLKLVFMSIELLRRSDADVVNKDVTECVLC